MKPLADAGETAGEPVLDGRVHVLLRRRDAQAAGVYLDQRCAEIGRDPAQIRRSVQLRVAEANDELLAMAQSYRAVGVTEVVLILDSQNPAGLAEQIAGLLTRLRAAG